MRSHTDSDQNLLGVDLLAVAEGDTVLGDKRGEARDVVDRVLLQVALVDAVQTLDVGITLVLQCVPVESGGSNLGEAVLLSIVDGLGNGSWFVWNPVAKQKRQKWEKSQN